MKTILLFFSVVFSITSVRSQAIDSMMSVYASNYPQQKVHVHFDKSVFKAGETIWFKAYIFAGFMPSTHSRNFYAELIDEAGNVVQRKAYPVIESSVAGNFDLAENTNSSQLIFRAYTGWMLNFDSAFHFTKQLSILNKSGIIAPVVKKPETVSLRFFPEGGDLVNTLESVVAFKANTSSGMPVAIKGEVKNSKGNFVASITTQHDGMGTFSFTPQPNETYTATYTDERGVERVATLPAAKSDGIVVKVSSAGAKKLFVVTRTVSAAEKFKTIYVVAHIAQQMIYTAKVPLQKNTMNSGTIITEKYASGILQLTVFSGDWKPVAERIVMIDNNEFLFDASVNTVEKNLNKRAKNILEIEVADSLVSNLSLSITDAEINEKPLSDNIISRLMLTGDLKGYVHNPAYYFKDEVAKQHLDLVMLTNGWRRYNWPDVLAMKTPVINYYDTSFLTLTAKVSGLGKSTLHKDEEITAVITTGDSGVNVLQIPKSSADVFSLPNVIFYDTAKVHFQFAKNRKLERKVTITFDNGLYDGTPKIQVTGLPLMLLEASDSAIKRTVEFAEQVLRYGSSWAGKGNVLETVTVRAKARNPMQELDKRYAFGMFSGGNAYAFDLLGDKYRVFDILTFLQGQIPGLTISRGNLSQVRLLWRNETPTVFIDEMQVEPDMLATISPTDVAYIKVFRPPFMGAFGGGAGGAIAIYTRRGGDETYSNIKGLATDDIVGYASVKEFYSPDYSTRSGSLEILADYRSTLYWNPVIITEPGNQKVKVEFFNNDISKSFRVVLEGVNEVGKLVRVEQIIK